MRDARSLILLILVAQGCYTSAARQHAIFQAVQAVNREHREAALARILRERGARTRPLGVRAEVLSWNEDLGWCAPSMRDIPTAPPRHDVVITRTEARSTLVIDCDALLVAVRGQTAFEARTEAGAKVLVIPERPDGAGEWRSLATTAAGKLLLLVPQIRVTATREVRVPGVCNRMPGVPVLRRIGTFFVIEGRTLADLEQVIVPFDGEEVSTKCDSNVE